MTVEEMLEKKKKNGLFTTKINLAEAFDKEDEGQKEAVEMMTQENGESHFIVMRELESAEMLDVQKTSQDEMADKLSKDLGNYICDHSFVLKTGNKLNTSEVVEIVKQSSSLLIHVLETWQGNLPLVKRMQKASAGRPE